MNFYACSLKTDLPITARYRGEITEVQKLDNGAIAFTEELPNGKIKSRIIPEGAVFIGTLQEAAKFYQPESDTVAVTTLHHFNTLNHVEPEPSTEEPERINTSPSILEGNTIKITGTLHVDAGFLRLKPNINFIGAKLGISVYDLSKPKPLEIELNPTPAEGLYLVDHVLDPNSEFLPSEHWHIPNDDCTFDELRGIKQITSDTIKALETQVAVLGLENTTLKQLNESTTKEQQEYSAYAHNLEKQLEGIKQESQLQSTYTKNLEVKLESTTLAYEALLNLKNEADLNHISDTKKLQKQILEVSLNANTSLDILKRFS